VLSDYTWMWTDRGPQRSWLPHIGKYEPLAASTADPLREHTSHHLRLPPIPHQQEGPDRRYHRPGRPRRTNMEGEGEEGERWDAVESYFSYLLVYPARRPRSLTSFPNGSSTTLLPHNPHALFRFFPPVFSIYPC